MFCDDLSFDADEPGYKELKAALDGSIAGAADNVLIYASSNRRHLMPEYMRDNLGAHHHDDGEVHPAEAVEERMSLSERFGLWLSFYPFRQDDYLDIVEHWLGRFGVDHRPRRAHGEALQFAFQRGSRSGRMALQFARHWAETAVVFGASRRDDRGVGADRRRGRRPVPCRRPVLARDRPEGKPYAGYWEFPGESSSLAKPWRTH